MLLSNLKLALLHCLESEDIMGGQQQLYILT